MLDVGEWTWKEKSALHFLYPHICIMEMLKFPIYHSDEYWPVMATSGSIDQGCHNRLKNWLKMGVVSTA